MGSKKIKVGVIFGGQSGEHEVSIVSALSVMSALDRNKYEVFPIGITKHGKWITEKKAATILKSRRAKSRLPEQIITPDPEKKSLVPIASSGKKFLKEQTKLDVVFPVLHGPYGEDGTIQGLLELSGIPYVGAGVLGSAVGMDKIVMKRIFRDAGLPVAKFYHFIKADWEKSRKRILDEIVEELNFPIFVKPANLGSSVGISKAKNRKDLIRGINEAIKYDRRIIVEEAVKNAREIEISVLGNDNPIVSVPGEVIASNEFYDYDAKYVDGKSKTIVPAKIIAKTTKLIQFVALKAFLETDCAGMARVDFLINRKTNKLYLNEINTIPGFTSISMYPKLWEATGINYASLLDKLINLAIERRRNRNKIITSYQPKKDWYRE